MNTQLFARVARALEPGQKRKYKREKENKTLLGVIGFDSVISFLYKTGNKEPRPKTQPAETKATFGSYEELKTYTDNLKAKRLSVSDEYADFELGYRFRAPDAATAEVWNNNQEPRTPATKVHLKKMAIHDSSSKGYSVSWDEAGQSATKVGDIFGLISADKNALKLH
jgi:hypothetical protein